jgi:hypothetical protein
MGWEGGLVGGWGGGPNIFLSSSLLYITLTMGSNDSFSLADLMSDPKFDFLHQFLSNDCANPNTHFFNDS